MIRDISPSLPLLLGRPHGPFFMRISRSLTSASCMLPLDIILVVTIRLQAIDRTYNAP